MEAAGAEVQLRNDGTPKYVLGRQKITDELMPHLKGFDGTEAMKLYGCKLTDASLSHLSNISSFGYLELGNNEITDAGLAHLAKIESIKALELKLNGMITDAGLAHLSGLTSLESLNLTRTQVTDAGLKHLYELKKLRRIDLSYTKVTLDGIFELRKHLPLLDRPTKPPSELSLIRKQEMATALQPLKVSSEKLDLVIDAPQGAKLEDNFNDSVRVRDPNLIAIDVWPKPLDLKDVKKELGLSIIEFVSDEPDRLIAKVIHYGNITYVFAINKKIGDRTYGVSNHKALIPEHEEHFRWIMKCVDSLRAK